MLLVPWLIDSRLVKNKISSELAKRTSGSVTFDKIALLWFPRPTLVIENTEISLEGNTRASIRNVRIYPSLYHLLTGRLIVRRALMEEPRLTLRVPQQHTGITESRWRPHRSVLIAPSSARSAVSLSKTRARQKNYGA